MEHLDVHDRFAELCRNYCEYPRSQLEAIKPHEVLYREQQWDNLEAKKDSLFDDEESNLHFWETGRLNKFPSEATAISEPDILDKHLNRGDQDPHIRHIFIDSRNSRSPLNCSMDMFKSVCCYHQVDPSFLESLYTFGEQTNPIDLCLAHFKARDTLNRPSQERLELKKLGRSGRELRLSYLLRSVEYSTSGSTGVWGWQIRQAANYHSFDVASGRAFWITIKGNKMFQERLKKISTYLNVPPKTGVEEGDISPYLRASLATHIVYLSWCDEKWREFINDFEAAIRTTINPASIALVDDHIGTDSDNMGAWPKPLRISRKSTANSKTRSRTNTMNTTGSKTEGLSRALTSASSTLSSWLRREKTPLGDSEQAMGPPACATNISVTSFSPDPQGMLDKIRFKDIQSLHKHAEVIQKAQLVLDLNIGVLHDIHQYYGNVSATEFKENSACQDAIEEFREEVTAIRRMLETRLKQLQCLAINLGQGISLYERVLQQRTNHINNMFAEIAHNNNIQMQDISDKTSRQTTSMHVITVATLFFLPATFVATFFQSGVFLWNEETPEGMTEPFKWQSRNFHLFLKVCFPLTVITMGTWLYMCLRIRKKVKQRPDISSFSGN